MDPIEILELCRKGALEGVPGDVTVPGFFTGGDYENLWRREQKKVRSILDDIVCGDHASEGLDLLVKAGVIDALFPELAAIRLMGNANGAHKNVWDHSKLVMAGVPADAELRWAALFHDIGKSTTRRFEGHGKVTFHNHDLVGARMVDRMQARMKFFGDDTSMFRTVRLLVQHHLRPAAFKPDATDHAVRRFIADCTETGDRRFMEKLMFLSRADITTKSSAKRVRAKERADLLVQNVERVLADLNAPKLPKGTMGAIIAQSGKKPGAWTNELRDGMEARMKAGALEANKDMTFYVEIGLKEIADAS